MDDPENAVDEIQKLNDVFLRFYDFLYNYSELRQLEHGINDDRDPVYVYRYASQAKAA